VTYRGGRPLATCVHVPPEFIVNHTKLLLVPAKRVEEDTGDTAMVVIISLALPPTSPPEMEVHGVAAPSVVCQTLEVPA